MTMSDPTRFLIVGMQRSGTTVTHHCLEGHPHVSLVTDEVAADPFFTKGLSVFTTGRESFDARRRGFLRLFDAITLSVTDRQVRAAGLKVALGTATDAIDLVECVREHFEGLKIVMVRRSDLVAQCASLRRAQRTGQWHAFGSRVKDTDDRFEIPVREFDDYARGCRLIHAQLDRLKDTHQVCELVYERDIEHGLDHDRLFDFVGVDRVPASWMKMQKVSPPVESYIANHAQLSAHLATVPFVAPDLAKTDAIARQRARATTEQPFFLVFRASDRLRRSRLEEAELDIQALVARASGLDPWLCGRADGIATVLVARGNTGLQSAREAFGSKHRESGVYYMHRAEIELMNGLLEPALQDLHRASIELSCAPHDQTRVARLLEQALQAKGDSRAAGDFVVQLLDRYPESAPFLFLGALLAKNTGQQQTAASLLARALAADPGHQRAKQLLATMG